MHKLLFDNFYVFTSASCYDIDVLCLYKDEILFALYNDNFKFVVFYKFVTICFVF